MRAVAIRAVVAALLLLAAGAFAIDWNQLVLPGRQRETNDATVQGDPTQLKARVAGYLAAVPVADYQVVHRGDLLYALEDSDYRARAARAEADVAEGEAAAKVAQAQLAEQAAEVDVAAAQIKAGEASLAYAHEERARQAALVGTESYLARDWQNAVAADQQAAAALAGQRKALAAQQAQTQVRQAQLEGARASLAARRAALDYARVELGYTRIAAPFDGVVTQRLARVGDYVGAGTALISVVPLQTVWVVANYREVQLTHVRPGQRAEVRIDAIPGVVLAGRVDSLEPVSEAQASAMPPDRSTGNFTKVVQRVPVKIVLDPRPDLVGRVLVGLSAETRVDTGAPPSPDRTPN